MASSASRFHAVVLVLDQGKDLQPLVSPDLPAALLPVANDPVLSYSLRLLDSCQVSGVTLVVSGKSRALQVSQWLAQEQDLGLPPPGTAGTGPGSGAGPGSVGPSRRLIREILVVPESFGSADAVRAVLSQGKTASISSEGGPSVGSGPQNSLGVIITTWSSSSSSSISSSAQDSARAQASTDDSSHAKGGGGDGDSIQAGRSARVGRLSDSLLVLDAAVISNLSLGAVASAHCRSGATVTTVLIASGQASTDGAAGGGRGGGHGGEASSKDKGKGRGLGSASGDLIGLDASGKQQLVFFSGDWKGPAKGSGGSAGAVGVSRTVLESGGGMVLHSSFQDARVYVFDSAKLHVVLEDKPKFSCLRRDVLPHLVQQQWQEHREQQREKLQAMAQGSGGLLGVARSFSSTKEPSAAVMQLLGYARGQPRGTQCCAYVAPQEVFWRRVSSLPSFAEANHALIAEEAVPLTGLELSQANNIVHRTVTLGSKSAVGAHCLVGEGTQFGEKCSVKRSLVGRHCRVGANVKITDSVIMDYVTLESGCIIQGCIVSSHATVKELRSIKDCHIGPHAVVTSDEKDANLTKP